MKPNEYVRLAMRTNAADYIGIACRMTGMDEKTERDFRAIPDGRPIDLMHAGIGMATEGGEFLDAVKKHIFYGAELDKVNLAEEVGDMLWYCALACSALGVDMAEVMHTNINKLKKRYPHQFNLQAAIDRDLEGEREILEGGE